MTYNITDTRQLEPLLKGWNVLVVEDDPDALAISSLMLRKVGATVLQASDGQTGLTLVRQHHPRFILTDLNMPIMDGWEMMAKLNRDRSTSDIPVIALTAVDMPGDREKALATGFTNFIIKPLEPKKFISELLNILVDVPELRLLIEASGHSG